MTFWFVLAFVSVSVLAYLWFRTRSPLSNGTRDRAGRGLTYEAAAAVVDVAEEFLASGAEPHDRKSPRARQPARRKGDRA